MILGQLITAYRKANGISLRQLAKTIGIKHESLFRFERGVMVDSGPLLKIFHWALLGIRKSDHA